jgi:hypothetical protein
VNRDYERRRDLLLLHADSPPPWTPAAVPGCILYGGGYQEARATRGAAPTIINGTFADASGWALGADWSIGGGVASVNTASTDVRINQQAGLIAGNRYQVGWGIPSWTSGVWIRCMIGSGDARPDRAAAGTYLEEATCTGTAWLYFRANQAVASVDNVTASNLSLQSYTPAFTTVAGSVLAQATATAQPWAGALGIMGDGGDGLAWNAAASNVKCLHDGSGGTFIMAVRPSVINAANFVAATAPTAAYHGVRIGYTHGPGLRVSVGNGSGVFDVDTTVATPLVVGTTYVLTYRVAAGANGVTLRKNGANIITAALTAPSAADPTSALHFGIQVAGGAGVNGTFGHPFVANRVLTDAECTAVENYILAQATL